MARWPAFWDGCGCHYRCGGVACSGAGSIRGGAERGGEGRAPHGDASSQDGFNCGSRSHFRHSVYVSSRGGVAVPCCWRGGSRGPSVGLCADKRARGCCLQAQARAGTAPHHEADAGSRGELDLATTRRGGGQRRGSSPPAGAGGGCCAGKAGGLAVVLCGRGQAGASTHCCRQGGGADPEAVSVRVVIAAAAGDTACGVAAWGCVVRWQGASSEPGRRETAASGRRCWAEPRSVARWLEPCRRWEALQLTACSGVVVGNSGGGSGGTCHNAGSSRGPPSPGVRRGARGSPREGGEGCCLRQHSACPIAAAVGSAAPSR